uniref:Uncharacterized protein n=1 Tax=Oryza brachyantha TaxID=4533 RepID=J3MGY8_ORYBR
MRVLPHIGNVNPRLHTEFPPVDSLLPTQYNFFFPCVPCVHIVLPPVTFRGCSIGEIKIFGCHIRHLTEHRKRFSDTNKKTNFTVGL